MGVLIDKLLTVNDCTDSQKKMSRKREKNIEEETGKKRRLFKSRLTCL